MIFRFLRLVPVKALFLLGCAASLFSSCLTEGGERYQLETACQQFAESYFNWQFQQASQFSTASSEKWLRYAASNVTQDDIDILREMENGADCVVEQAELSPHGQEATATVVVRHFLDMRPIGTPDAVTEEARFLLHLTKENNQWKVMLQGLPRPLKAANTPLPD